MSFIPEKSAVQCNSFQIAHPPPIRKLFASTSTEDGKTNDENNDTFKVFLRIKPNSELEHSNDCIRIEDSVKLVCKPPPSSKHKKLEKIEYRFSHIFGPKTSQIEIFSKCVVNCITDLLNSTNSLILTYGTTNAGKTFTVQGSAKNPGIIPQSIHTLFSNIKVHPNLLYKPCLAKDVIKISLETSLEEVRIKNEVLSSFRASCKSAHQDSSHFMQSCQNHSIDLNGVKPSCDVWISFLEVYNETIYDLLDSKITSRKALKIATDSEDNFYVKELKHIYVSNAEEAFAIYQFGKKNLNIASTKMNENSSRSHCIFIIHVVNLDDENNPYVSKLSICDLAGSERLTKTQNTGLRLKESGNINGSLFQLNRCLRAIRENQTRGNKQLIPYRPSNLTKLLHTALDDRRDEKIVMIVNINPSAELYDETQQVLKIGAIASKIKNKPLAHTFQRSTRFTSLIYGRETVSVGEGHSPLEDLYESDQELKPDDDEVQGLLELLLRRDAEINQLKKTIEFQKESYQTSKKNLQEYCDKVQTTYKNRVKRLEERLESQKSYYLWKVNETKRNTILESIDETIRSEIDGKNARIEELESKLSELLCRDDFKNPTPPVLNKSVIEEEISKKDTKVEELLKKVEELEHELQDTNLSFSEKISEKDGRIKDLESLIQEAKEEYLFLEKKVDFECLKKSELEEELYEKNETIEQLECRLEEYEQKIEHLEEMLSQDTIEHEQILHKLEKDRDTRVAECETEIGALNEKLRELEELQKGNEIELAKMKNLIQENSDKDKQLDNLRCEIEELSKEKDDIVKDRECKLAALRSEIQKLSKEKDDIVKDKESKLAALRSEIQELSKEKDDIVKDRESKLAALRSEIQELSKEKDDIVKDRESKLAALRCEIEELNKQKDALQINENNCVPLAREIEATLARDIEAILTSEIEALRRETTEPQIDAHDTLMSDTKERSREKRTEEEDDKIVSTRKNRTGKLENSIISPSLADEKNMAEAIICLKKLQISEADMERNIQISDIHEVENIIPRRYNTRTRGASYRTPSGKENHPFVEETPKDKKSTRKSRARKRTPLGVSIRDDSSDANVFRNACEKGKTPDQRQLASKSMKKIFPCSPSQDLGSPSLYSSSKKKLFSVSPSPDFLAPDYQLSVDTSRIREMTTPQQTVKLTKKKK